MRTSATVLFSGLAVCFTAHPCWGGEPVIFASDLQSVDRAVLEAAELPLPQYGGGPVLTAVLPRSGAGGGVAAPARARAA